MIKYLLNTKYLSVFTLRFIDARTDRLVFLALCGKNKTWDTFLKRLSGNPHLGIFPRPGWANHLQLGILSLPSHPGIHLLHHRAQQGWWPYPHSVGRDTWTLTQECFPTQLLILAYLYRAPSGKSFLSRYSCVQSFSSSPWVKDKRWNIPIMPRHAEPTWSHWGVASQRRSRWRQTSLPFFLQVKL